MSSIRRVLSGISSSISRTRLEVETEPVTPLTPREPLQPIAPVRRGFSDQSDFQVDGEDLGAPLAADASDSTGRASRSEPAPEQLRVFSGESSFESASTRSRYAQMLGSQLPSSLGAPQERSGGASSVSGGRGRGVDAADDLDDLLSPDAAAWELQNLDTSTPSVVEPEDLLFMLDPPGSAGPADPVLELGLDDIFDVDAIDDVAMDALDDASHVPPEFLDPAVRPAGPDEFLADTNDLGSMVPEEPSVGDAALAGVLAPLAASPAAASAPVAAALASQGVEAVADTFEVAPPAQATVDLDAAVSGEPATQPPVTSES